MERSNPANSNREIVPFDSYDYVEEITNINNFNHSISKLSESTTSSNTPKSSSNLSRKIVNIKLVPVQHIRRIKNFVYCDVFATALKHLFLRDNDDPSNFFILFGELIAQTNHHDNHKVKIIVADITVFYGTGAQDPLHGIWVQDVQDIWYQLVPPCHTAYQQLWDNVSSKLFPLHYSKPSNYGKERQWDIHGITIHGSNSGQLVDLFQLQLPPKLHKITEGKKGDKDDTTEHTLIIQGNVSVVFDKKVESFIRVMMTVAQYEVCYGGRVHPQHDNDRGIWVRCSGNPIWYKITNSSISYEKIFESMKERAFGNKQTLGSYDVRSNYYRDILRRVTYTALVDEKGKSVPYVFHQDNKKSSDREHNYLLRGYALPKEDDTAVPVCISTFVGDYVIDLGRKNHPDYCVYLKAPLFKIWYRIDPKLFSEQCVASHAASSAHLLSIINSYNWPSETAEVWRRIDNFSLVDLKGNYASMLTSCAPNKTSILRGQLMKKEKQNPNNKPLNVQLYCEQYSIDYGIEVEDENRGLWLKDENEGWYKVLSPHQSYSDYAWEALVKTQKFLKIHETLVFDDASYCNCDEKTGLFKCTMTISELFLESKGSFDLSFVLENKEFICNNLEGGFDIAGSKKLFSSINKLTKKEVQKCEDELEKQEYSSMPQSISPTNNVTTSDGVNDEELRTVTSQQEQPSEDKSVEKSPSKKRKNDDLLKNDKESSKMVAEDVTVISPLKKDSDVAKKRMKQDNEITMHTTPKEYTESATIALSDSKSANSTLSNSDNIKVQSALSKAEERKASVYEMSQPSIPPPPSNGSSSNIPSSSSSKIIKKRNLDPVAMSSAVPSSVTSVSSATPGHSQVQKPSATPSITEQRSSAKNSKFCNYCRKLEKSKLCANALHNDGGYYGESKEEIEKRILAEGGTIGDSSQRRPNDTALPPRSISSNNDPPKTSDRPPDGKRSWDKMRDNGIDEESKVKERYMKKHEAWRKQKTTSASTNRSNANTTSETGDVPFFTWKTTAPDLSVVPKKSCLRKVSSYDVDSINFDLGLSTKSNDSISLKKKVRWIEGGTTGVPGEILMYDNTETHHEDSMPSHISY